LEIVKRAKASVWTEDTNPQRDEPIISAERLYGLGDAHLTVNAYGALCLNSNDLFIVDIDGHLDGGQLLGKYPWLSTIDCICQALSVLDQLAGSDFMQQFYRVYNTCAGYRVICTSKPMKVNTLSLSLMRFLYADPRYAAMCERDKNYRARLSPKPHRVLGEGKHLFEIAAMRSVYDVIDDWFICHRAGWFLNGVGWYDSSGEEVVHPDLIEQLRVHDDFCLKVKDGAAQG
jgi:hypothetical protein